MKTVLVVLGDACAALMPAPPAWAANPPPALSPRSPTGFSTVEQGWKYAPPDEGRFEFPLALGLAGNNEVQIAPPQVCEGSARATVTYSKAQNRVLLDVDYHGLPYRPSFTRPRDVSNPYVQWPVSVENANYQVWFLGRQFNFTTTFYYSGTTLQLIGSEFDLPNGPPAGSIPVAVPSAQMIGTNAFEPDEDGEAHPHFEFNYDQILDNVGSGGTYVSTLPFNLCKPDEYGIYYTQGGLPASLAMNFDQVLDSIHGGYGMIVHTSLEPQVKPAYLRGRDNTMVVWGGLYPMAFTPGTEVNPYSGALRLSEGCQTHVVPDFAPGYFNICGG